MSALTNRVLRNSPPAMLLAVLALVVALTATATAAGVVGRESKSTQVRLNTDESAGNNVDGSWTVTVTRVNPPASVPPTFKSLMTFDRGGGLTETSNTGTTLRGPAHGVWQRINARLYATTMLFFRFNPQTGAFLGTQKVNRTMRLSQDGQTFEAVSLATQYDPDGVLTLGGLHATETGERINVERIADKP